MDARRSSGDARAAASFRADPSAAVSERPSHRQSFSLLAVLVLICAAVGVASYVVQPARARSFSLVHGSVFIPDQVAPVGIDLASGKPTLRLVGADKQVGTTKPATLGLIGVQDGTLILNRTTGEFNMVDETGFVIKHDGGGVLLARRRDPTTAAAVPAGDGSAASVPGAAYLVRSGPAGTNLLVVNRSNVEAASRGVRTVRPRASLTTPLVADTGPGGVAGAGGALWVLFGTGDQRTVREYAVPTTSGPGARLRVTERGTAAGPAALGTATTGPGGLGPASVAVASPDRIRVFTPVEGSGAGRLAEHDLALPARAGTDQILPVSDAAGRITFLMHATGGWSVVSVTADGTRRSGPYSVRGVPADVTLAPPGASDGSVYTIARSGSTRGAIYRIALDGRAATVPGAAMYPLARSLGHAVENNIGADAVVLARQSRVIVNSPSHLEAVAVFTDGSRRPLVIQKSSAVDVSTFAGIEALTRNNLDPSSEQGKTRHTTAPPRTTAQQINNKVDCERTQLKPRIPLLGTPQPGSRSVQLNWTYTTLDPQDCLPSTYVVGITALTPGAPTPKPKVTVQGQTGVTITGLYPETQYRFVVTAYLHGEGTASAAQTATTGPEGPAAPTNLRVTADSSGNWDVRWDGCSGSRCIGATGWRVTPTYCDGLGVSTPPAALDTSADSTVRQQTPVVYRGTDALLGRGLSFQVVGTGDQGEPGTPSAASPCVYSWTRPVGSAISVAASSPPPVATDSTTSITASVRFADSAVHDLGGVGGSLTYQLLSGGTPISSVGPTTSTSAVLTGIRAGDNYQVRVIATPPRHPEAALTLAPVAVQPATAPWPSVSVTSTFANDTFDTGTLSYSFSLPAGTDTHGETFDLTDNSILKCGSYGRSLTGSDVSPGQKLTLGGIDRFQANGSCTVQLQLQQHSGSLFGAGNSDVVSNGISIPQPDPTSTKADFSAAWSGDDQNPAVTVSYHGQDHLGLASGWTITGHANGGSASCGTTHSPTTATFDFDTGCVSAGGPFTVSIDYTYLGTSQHFDVDVNGTAPSPVDQSKLDFTRTWNTDPANPAVDVAYTGQESRARLQPLKWTETVTWVSADGATETCGTSNANPGAGDLSVPIDYTLCPPFDATGAAATYTLNVHYDDPTYNRPYDKQFPVGGTPPT